MNDKNNNEKINEETPKVITPGTENIENNKPQIVEVTNTNEVNQKTVETKKRTSCILIIINVISFRFCILFTRYYKFHNRLYE